MHKFTHLIYLVIIAVLGILLYTQQQAPVDVTAANESGEQTAGASETNGRSASRRASDDGTIAALEAEIERLQVRLQSESEPEGEPPEPSAPDSPTRYAGGGPDEILQRLEAEERDDEWAYQAETAISDLFYTNDDLSEAELEEVDCRATMCKIVVITEDARLKEVPALLTSAIRNEAGLDSSFTSIQQRDDTIRLILDQVEATSADDSR